MTQELPSIEATIAFIQMAHNGQIDKDNRPHSDHAIAVMQGLGADAPHEWKLAALLHDVLEDTEHTRESLSANGYSDEVLDIVELLTFTDREGSYPELVKEIIDSGNEGAIRIKLSDVSHNSSYERLRHLPEDEQQEKRAKYRYPKEMLIRAVAELDRAAGVDIPVEGRAASR